LSSAWSPSPHIPPAGAPPGAVGQEAAAPRSWSNLGTLCMVLAGAQLLWFVYTVASAALALVALRYVSGYLGSASPGTAGAPGQLLDGVEAFARSQAIWQIARAVPFAACSVALAVIGFGIYRGRERSLRAARTWVWVALAVVALSLCLQIFVLIPESLEYQRLLGGRMGTTPLGAKGSALDTYTLVMSIIMPIGWSVILAAWPIALRVWTDRLLLEASAATASASDGASPMV